MRRGLSVLVALCLFSVAASAQQTNRPSHWVGTWAAAPAWRSPLVPSSPAVVPLAPVVAPLPSPAPAAAPPPAPASSGASSAAPLPSLWPQGQTLRQIVHT